MVRKVRQSEPLRYQIRKSILDLLLKRKYNPGEKIPTEQELIEELNVSRSTLREGLHLLEEERILRSKHGSGRYLISSPGDFKFDITRLQSVTEMLAIYGIQVTTRVLQVKECPADESAALNLEMEVGEPVFFLERVRYAKDVPIIYSIDILDRKIMPGEWRAEEFAGSLLSVIEERWGIYLDHSRATIGVVPYDENISRRVGSDENIPWILLEQTNYNHLGEPLIYSKDYHRSDYITFNVRRFRS